MSLPTGQHSLSENILYVNRMPAYFLLCECPSRQADLISFLNFHKVYVFLLLLINSGHDITVQKKKILKNTQNKQKIQTKETN